ncbi:transcriptional-regulating factor 1 isoform X2 [Nothobranchius furzeri]
MEDRSSFANLQHPRLRPSFSLTVHGFQSSEAGCPTSQPAQDSLEHYGTREQESPASFLTSNVSSGPRRMSSLDGDAGLGGHFDDSWYAREGMWDDGESGESTAEDFHGKSYANDAFCTMSCGAEEEDRWRIRSNLSSCGGCEDKSDYSRPAFTTQEVSYNRAGSFSGTTNSKLSQYTAGDEDYGSSCGSAEDQLQPAEAEGSWISGSRTGGTEVRGQPEGRWRGPADSHSLSSGCVSQRSPVDISSRTYTQKLDSFSEAFLSQKKRRFQTLGVDSSGQIWENGMGTAGMIKSIQSCAFDSDSGLPPSSSSSSSPACPSLLPFPSPPTSSHLMSSVLSPPPTPLPPPSHSPSKTDSPSTQGGSRHPEPPGGLQFFSSHMPSMHSSGMIWKFPLLSHCIPQPWTDPSSTVDSSRIPASSTILQPPGSPSLTSPSLHSSGALSSSSSSLNSFCHLPFLPFPGEHQETTERTSVRGVSRTVKSEAVAPDRSQIRPQTPPVYTGRPFPSILHSRRSQKRGRYTPPPLLSPVRRGPGLYSSLSLHHREEETPCGEEEEEESRGYVNIGPDFQAELPPRRVAHEWSGVWLTEDDSPPEELLWKPSEELTESDTLQSQVEKLLSVCSSSCLPGGGSNTDLALHCLHYCQGDTMATLEMLLFSHPSPTGDYHYSGCDFWTDTEKSLFSAALRTHGKDFSLIKKTVRTKTVSQCVEFFYLSQKLTGKQKKQKEDERRDAQEELQTCKSSHSQPLKRPYTLEEAVSVPPLASFFPCKLCGKMFYKIKSRNAHMKIHRQPQEDWTDRQLQHQLLTQSLALGRPNNLVPSPGSSRLQPQASALTFSSCGLVPNSNIAKSIAIAPNNISFLDPNAAVAFSNTTPPNSHLITINSSDVGELNRKDPSAVLSLHQPWGSFGHSPDLSTFYCLTEGKEDGGGGVEGKETISWQ